jgi:deoxyribodipyrimidine photo-lyase
MEGKASQETRVMWFRRDLRVNDLPALTAAVAAGKTVPCFIFDERLLTGYRFVSPARVSFMLGCLSELRGSLRNLGADLFIRIGLPEVVLPELAKETGATSVHWTEDASPWANRRDQRVSAALVADGFVAHPHPGSYIVADPGEIVSGKGTPYTVYSPFFKALIQGRCRPWKNWASTRRPTPA